MDLIERRAAIDAVHEEFDDCLVWDESGQRTADEFEIIIDRLPSAQPEIAENLYQYKCYITDREGLQHEVIHTDDIRMVTGWEI